VNKSALFLASIFFPSTVPDRKPWTPSTHAQWPAFAQHSVHMMAAVLWKVRVHGKLMQMPYELVEIILRHVL
jgi:hypothetical protein